MHRRAIPARTAIPRPLARNAACLSGGACPQCGPVTPRRWPVAALLTIAMAPLAIAFARADDPLNGGEQGAPTATGTGPLTTSTVVELLEIVAPGTERETRRFVAADTVRAGDEVYYTIRVRNPGREPVSDIVVTKRLPFGMRYARGSALGPDAEIQFSADGGDSFGAPSALEVRSGGQPRRRAVAADYTHVRWRLRRPLAPGATALLRFRATLS